LPEYAGVGKVLDVGETLQLFRDRDNKAQGEIAGETGVSVTTISNIESGKNPRPHLSTIRRLARAFGLSAEGFLVREGLADPKAQAPPSSLEQWLSELTAGHAYHAMDAAEAQVSIRELPSLEAVIDRREDLDYEKALIDRELAREPSSPARGAGSPFHAELKAAQQDYLLVWLRGLDERRKELREQRRADEATSNDVRLVAVF
jgi:transcriptional regulator with XRE-family HTH domain